MEGLEQKTVELLDKIEVIVTRYSPEVANVTLDVVRTTSATRIIYGIICIVFCVICFTTTKKLVSKFVELKKRDGANSDWDIGAAVSYVAGGFLTIIFSCSAAFKLLDLWNWVALFYPKLALAKKILGM